MKVAWDEALPEPFRLREEAVLRAAANYRAVSTQVGGRG
jgi:hypothetical protein